MHDTGFMSFCEVPEHFFSSPFSPLQVQFHEPVRALANDREVRLLCAVVKS